MGVGVGGLGVGGLLGLVDSSGVVRTGRQKGMVIIFSV